MSKKKFLSVFLAGSLALSACAAADETDSSLMEPDSAAVHSEAQNFSMEEEATQEPCMQEQDYEIQAPDFLSEEQKDLYYRANKMYAAFVTGVGGIEYQERFPIRENDKFEKLPNVPIVRYGREFYPANGRYHSWKFLDQTLHALFTDDFIQQNFYTSQGWVNVINVDGRTYLAPTDRGYAPGYDEVIWDFQPLYIGDDYVQFQISTTYHYPNPESETEPEESFASAYLAMVKTDSGWRFSYFEAVY